jgi:hypothetical protein
MQSQIDDLDLPKFGAAEFARILKIQKPNGEPDVRRMFYLLECGYVDADKLSDEKSEDGKKNKSTWVSTTRRLLASFSRRNAA